MICIAEHNPGAGGIAGGAGESGQSSQVASGAAARGYGYPVIEAVTGMDCHFDVQLTKDYEGTNPADLSNIGKVDLCMKPSMHSVNNSDTILVDCAFTPDGMVSFDLDRADLNDSQGVWFAEFRCFTGENNESMVQNYRAYVVIRKGTRDSSDGPYPLTVMDVRLALMDTSAAANQLLDDLEFSDMMILNCIMRAVDEWNETPPQLSQRFDATNFPWREHLLQGTVGYLLQMVAYRYTRNRMQYSAAGFQMDVNDKGPQYIQLAQIARQEWRAFIASKKTELNMQECCGVFSMPEFGSF